MAAARELKAARKYIQGLEQHVAAADERIKLAELQIAAMKEARTLESDRARELEAVIAAERSKIAIAMQEIDLQKQRIKKLDGQVRRARKFALITGVAAAVGILIAAIGK